MKKLFLFLIFLPFIIRADGYPEQPSNYVTDDAEILSDSQKSSLNRKLKEFEDSTTNEVFVYIAKSLEGRSLESLCQEIFHNWRIGDKEKNNGVLVAIFIDDHKFRIQTGYGLEGALPDVLTKRIQDEEMRPHFKDGDYYEGIDIGIDKLIYYSRHEYKAEMSKQDLRMMLICYGINLILLIILIYGLYKKNQPVKRSTGATTIILIIGIIATLIPLIGIIIHFILLGMIADKKKSGGSYSSSGSDYDSSYSSSSSYDSGSSFSGGGGGDSGGGGSSSDW
ncbi:MAG: hypothetical protein K0S32_1718 [Bacteroidetes bacterium]|jgi:uncharacterized protein|nr:hypothetical protein [Bacteroidota bacterium]